MSLPDLFRVFSIAPHLRVVRLPADGGVLLVGECEHFGITDREVAAVINALDGMTDVDGVLASCASQVAAGKALSILGRLIDRGLACEVQVGEAAQRAFASGLGLSASTPSVHLIHVPTSKDAGGDMAVHTAVAQALTGTGFVLHRDAKVVVLATSDYLAPGCRNTARTILASGCSCVWLKPSGLRPFFGPCFTGDPGQACPTCLCDLLSEQRPVEAFVQKCSLATPPLIPEAHFPASLAAAASLFALHLRHLLSQRELVTNGGTLWTLDFSRPSLIAHGVRRRPQCPDCGDPTWMAQRGAVPVTLSAAQVAFSQDGGFRIEPPAASYARTAHLVSDVLGPVTHLHPMPGVPDENPLVWSSGYRVRPTVFDDAESFYRRCAGKGQSSEQARMSALAECVERYAGIYRGDEATIDASYAQVADAALHPDALHLFSDQQRRNPGLAPPSLPPSQRILWTPAWSLTSSARRYLPLAYCYSEVPAERGATFCRPSSNGSAAGNCLEEAILQGLFELVERDAVAIWWYCRLRRPSVIIPGDGEASFASERSALSRLGWSMWTLDLTHDLGIPVVVAVGVQKSEDRLALGFGCHSLPTLALRRAVSELHQVVLPERPVRTPWHGMAASQMAFLLPDHDAPRQVPMEQPVRPDLREHIRALDERLRNCGLDLWVVDKSRADLNLRVAQVIVPGLRHAWPRFAPGRLYTVPVALGWLPTQPSEDELNPQPLLI